MHMTWIQVQCLECSDEENGPLPTGIDSDILLQDTELGPKASDEAMELGFIILEHIRDNPNHIIVVR
jgi:hypothetical protein